jgi:hypothetical protein
VQTMDIVVAVPLRAPCATRASKCSTVRWLLYCWMLGLPNHRGGPLLRNGQRVGLGRRRTAGVSFTPSLPLSVQINSAASNLLRPRPDFDSPLSLPHNTTPPRARRLRDARLSVRRPSLPARSPS